MFQSIISLLKQLSFFVGYVKSSNFKVQLTPEEEQQLLIKMANGDIDARNELVVRNLKLVCTMASKFSSGKMSWLDLFQDGVIGLIEAIDNFKITMDCRLSTYAVFHIKKSILTAFKDTYNTIRLPKYFFDRLKQYKMLEEKYAQNGEKNLTTEEISQILGVNSETAIFLQQYIIKPYIANLNSSLMSWLRKVSLSVKIFLITNGKN